LAFFFQRYAKKSDYLYGRLLNMNVFHFHRESEHITLSTTN